MDMQEQLRKIQEEAANQLENVRDKAGLDALRLKMLGKKGDLTQLLRSMGQLPAEERPKAGQMINVVRERLTEQMDALDSKIKRIEQEKKLERLQREIAALQDTTGDKERELEREGYNVTMQTVIKASVFDRVMKLEAELNKIHGRIIKLLDSIKGYEMESRRVRLEERKYNLAKQKLSGAYDIDPDTGEINDEAEEPDELEI